MRETLTDLVPGDLLDVEQTVYSPAGSVTTTSGTAVVVGPPASAPGNAGSTEGIGSAPDAASGSAAGADCTHRNVWRGSSGMRCRDCGATCLNPSGSTHGLLFTPHRFVDLEHRHKWLDAAVPPGYRWMHCRRCGEAWVGRTLTTYCCRCGQKDSTEEVR